MIKTSNSEIRIERNKVLDAIVEKVTQQYFEEMKEKHLSDISGRISLEIKANPYFIGEEISIVIHHTHDKNNNN